AEERTARAFLHRHWRAALLALDAGVDRLDRIALRVHVLGVLALRVAGAGQERAAFSLAQHHLLAALLADVLRRPGAQHRVAFRVEIHGRGAFRVAAATEERAAFAHPLHHRLAAGGALVLGQHRGRPGLLALARLDVLALGVAAAAGELLAGLLT